MIPRRKVAAYNSYYPWPMQEISKRGCTAPRLDKAENLYLSSRVPTSSSKYTEIKLPSTRVSIKPSGFKSYKPKEPIKTTSLYTTDFLAYKQQKTTKNTYSVGSPSSEEIEHFWEEGNKRPKTQNEKSRKRPSAQQEKNNSDAFPVRFGSIDGKSLIDVPIIVVKDDKNRRTSSAARKIGSRATQRPSTFQPARSTFASTLDPEFLGLFQM
ncbi:hypothetical protein SteCoe_6276 [Stentor coeruleus]|uniref:Uncharacterized protein n=1 Tax=Stentor coeruleus TaxID=5963 RepID=A0A1R2CQC1_9CILI|nr:hypothetical protein SteCoe_6276 [Stentor coeruleus]